MTKTAIEWTEEVWNPVRGCTKISPGCKHCYAETFAERWRGLPGHSYEQGFDLRLVPEKLAEPLRRAKATTYFVNSMSDLFHERVPLEYCAAVFAVMASTPRSTYQVLTKRPVRMREFFSWVAAQGPAAVTGYMKYLVECGAVAARQEKGMDEPSPPTPELRHVYNVGAPIVNAHMPGGRYHRLQRIGEFHWRVWPLDNVWLGVSVEDRKNGLPRIDELRATPAAVRFLSVEPLLEDLGTIDLTGIDWVIVGGESGHGARPMHPDWVRNIRDQALALRDVCGPCDGKGQWYYDINGEMGDCPRCHGRGFSGPAFFFKQWGEYCTPNQMPRETFLEWSRRDMEARAHPRNHPGRVGPVPIGKAKAGRELDGLTWDEMPVPRGAAQ